MVTTIAAGASTPPIQGEESKRPSSASTSGIDQALVLRHSANPQRVRSALSTEGVSGSASARRFTLASAVRDSGAIAIPGTGKKNCSPRCTFQRRGGGAEHESGDPLRVPVPQLLRHGAAEGVAGHDGVIDAEVVEANTIRS